MHAANLGLSHVNQPIVSAGSHTVSLEEASLPSHLYRHQERMRPAGVELAFKPKATCLRWCQVCCTYVLVLWFPKEWTNFLTRDGQWVFEQPLGSARLE